jgi:hypothetical protein
MAILLTTVSGFAPELVLLAALSCWFELQAAQIKANNTMQAVWGNFMWQFYNAKITAINTYILKSLNKKFFG